MKKSISVMLSFILILTMCLGTSGVADAAIILKDASTYPENFQHGTLLPDDRLDEITKIDNTNVFWEYKDGTLTISGKGPMNDYEFDDLEKAYIYSAKKKQYRIPWQNYQYEINKIVVKPGITHIGNYSFGFLKTLKKVEIADSVTDIGEAAFLDSGLEEIKIPDNVKVIKRQTFQGCTSLKKVDLNNTEVIRESAFARCVSLRSVTIPESVKEISTGYTFSETPIIKVKSKTPPEITPYVDRAGRKKMSRLTVLNSQTILIPKGADSKAFMSEIARTEDWDKTTWTIREYDDSPLVEIADNVSASFKIKKLKKGFRITVSSKDDALKNMGLEGSELKATYKYFRSTKKNSGYKLMKETTKPTYKNTKVKKGKRYYYKVTVTISIVPGGIVFGDEEGEDIRTLSLPAKRTKK